MQVISPTFNFFVKVKAKKAYHSLSALMAMSQSNATALTRKKRGKPEINKLGTKEFVIHSTGVKEQRHRDYKSCS